MSANGTVERGRPARCSPPAGTRSRAALVSAGMPEAVVDGLVRDAARMLAPFDPDATPTELVRRMLARHDAGRARLADARAARSRSSAPAGSGKTLTAAKLAHAYAGRSPFTVRTLSLEPGEGADRLAALTEGLDMERRSRRHARRRQGGGARPRPGRRDRDRHAPGLGRRPRRHRGARPRCSRPSAPTRRT